MTQSLVPISMNEIDTHVDEANARAVERMAAARPVFVDIRPARECLPDFDRRVVLHAGPPIEYGRMCPPMRTAIQAAVVYEEWAPDVVAADQLLASGGIELAPCHSRQSVGTMTGIISPSVPVFVVENEAEPNNRAYGRVTEGFGSGLRFGNNSPENIARLRWVRDRLAPALRAGLHKLPDGRLPMRPLIAEALLHGDELHMRNAASTALLIRTLCTPLAEALNGKPELPEVLHFLTNNNNQFFLDMIMASAKVIADAGRGVDGSSVVACIARNGVEVGIQLCGMPDRWFTGPANIAEGRIFNGYTIADANRDVGDSAITETIGLGNMAIAASPAIVPFLGRTAYKEAEDLTQKAYEITVSKHPEFLIPVRNFEGVPFGIDVRKVVQHKHVPHIDTAIAPRDPSVGSIVGAGISRPPFEIFEAAAAAVYADLEDRR